MARGVTIDASALVGTSDTTMLAADGGRCFLMIHNPGTGTIGVSFNATSQINGISSVTLASLGTMLFDQGVPTGPVRVVASATNNPVTLLYMKSAAAAI